MGPHRLGPATSMLGADTPTPRIVIIVARDRPELHEYFESAFVGVADVKVILDRRIEPAAPGPAPGGSREGRGRRDIYEDLERRGFVIVRLW